MVLVGKKLIYIFNYIVYLVCHKNIKLANYMTFLKYK